MAAAPDRAQVIARIEKLGWRHADAATLADQFIDAELRGKPSHGLMRIHQLGELDGIDPQATPERTIATPGFEYWEGRGALGYLTLAAICRAQIEDPPAHARVIVAANTFPTGMLGHWVRQLADAGLTALLTANSPPQLASPDGGPRLAGTNPIAIGVPSSDGRPLVSDVSMGAVTYGDVMRGTATHDELVPFGGEQAHKSFALALGLHLMVDALTGLEDGYGSVFVVAPGQGDPVGKLHQLVGDLRLPGDAGHAQSPKEDV